MKNFGLILVASVFMLSSCTTTYKAVATFDDYNEVLVGTVIHNIVTGGGTFRMVGKVSGIDCTGKAILVSIPPTGAFAGQGGKIHARCTDGRTVTGEWWATSLTTGFGRGEDDSGARFAFTFGYSEEEAAALIQQELPRAKSKPQFPVYDPEATRLEKGFSTGTGFFIADGGYILTNYHVVNGVREIVVHTHDRRSFAAHIIAKDPANDIAIVKIEESFPAVPLAGTDKMRKASEVMTLGYPLVAIQGQEQKATFGRVNALFGAEDDVRFMQIDVPVQPGNSGGPLFDEQGNVVGIVSSTLNQVNALKESGVLPQNVNYAVKSDYAFPLIGSAGIDLPNGDSGERRQFADIIPAVEKSVVLVITK